MQGLIKILLIVLIDFKILYNKEFTITFTNKGLHKLDLDIVYISYLIDQVFSAPRQDKQFHIF